MDLLTERISIQSSASLKSASVGDIVSYATIVQNRANGNITMADGGVELIDELPVGFELVKGSYAVFKVSDANQYTEITGLPEPSGRFSRFGAFELLADSNTKYGTTYRLKRMRPSAYSSTKHGSEKQIRKNLYLVSLALLL